MPAARFGALIEEFRELGESERKAGELAERALALRRCLADVDQLEMPDDRRGAVVASWAEELARLEARLAAGD